MKVKITIWLLFSCFFTYAQTSLTIKNLQEERKKALQDIEITNRLINETSQSRSNILTSLNLLSEKMSARRKVIDLLTQELNVLDQHIKSTENEIKILEKELEYKKNNYAKSVQYMYRHINTQDKLLFILSADNFAQSYRRIRYLKQYSVWQKEQGLDILEKQQELEEKKKNLARDVFAKNSLMQESEKESEQLKEEETRHQGEITNLSKQEQQLRQELEKKKKQADALNQQIEKIIAEEIAKAEQEKKATDDYSLKPGEIAKEERIAETSGGYAMTKAERQLSANFANNKGKLPYPLQGAYKITGRFGVSKHDNLKYVTTNNNGIDIQTTAGNEARSVFNGVVTKIFVVPGYNNSVIVRHGNYLSVYCNLSEVYVKNGDQVKTGQALGKIFTDTEEGNVAILHFEIWKERSKLNPEAWIN